MAKQVTVYESDGVTPAASSYDEGTLRDGEATVPRRLWWQNSSTASETLEACQFTLVPSGANDGDEYLQLAEDLPFAPPGAAAPVAVSGAGLEIGAYIYSVTFVSANGETTPGTQTNVTTSAGNQQVSLSGIPTGPAGIVARRVYRTAVGGSDLCLVAEIPDNTTTMYADTTPDASLGAAAPTLNTSGIPAAWGNADIVVGDVPVDTLVACWMRYSAPTGTTQIGNPRTAYVQFEEA